MTISKVAEGDNNSSLTTANDRLQEEAGEEQADDTSSASKTLFTVATTNTAESKDEEDTDISKTSPVTSTSTPDKIREIRDQLFLVAELASRLGRAFRKSVPYDDAGGTDELLPLSKRISPVLCSKLQTEMSRLLSTLLSIATLSNVDLKDAVLGKLELNKRKYPVHLSKGKAGKYTEYSDQTGITPTKGQSITSMTPSSTGATGGAKQSDNTKFVQYVPDLTMSIRKFALERDWSQFHTPRSLLLALIGEVGELAELYQWMGDYDNDKRRAQPLAKNPQKLHDKTSQELADVTIYLMRLADVCGIELSNSSVRDYEEDE